MKAVKKVATKLPKTVSVLVNGIKAVVPNGTTILEAASKAGYTIPTLCYLKEVNNDTSCRICVVEVKGARNLVAACNTVCTEGMEVATNSEKVIENRKTSLELILSNHNKECLSCQRSQNCELQKLSKDYNCDENHFRGSRPQFEIDKVSTLVSRDNNKCVLCRRCTAMCSSVQSVGVISAQSRGFTTFIGSAFEKPLKETPCVLCGQCITVCPTAALTTTDAIEQVKGYIKDESLHTVVGVAPAVRVALGEEFGLEAGKNVEGKMIAALKRLGFTKVFDVSTTADLTVMEEGAEFLDRLRNNGKLPILTSCSPGWVNFLEYNFPELIENLSSCKSPQQMFGAIMKTYYAEKLGINQAKIRVVTIMPCIAKKAEAKRDNQSAAGVPDVDAVLTTAELAKFIKNSGIDFESLKDEKFDDPLGTASSAGLIFGATGGVAEASIRTIVETASGKKLDKIEFSKLRGTAGSKEAQIVVDGKEVRVLVVHGLANARKAMNDVKGGSSPYHLIEVMACPGGCVTGGGQPVRPSSLQNHKSLKALRAKDLYDKDKKAKVRRSHENSAIKALYSEFLEKPGSHKAHKILHTTHNPKEKFS